MGLRAGNRGYGSISKMSHVHNISGICSDKNTKIFPFDTICFVYIFYSFQGEVIMLA